jgi:hypothetical protein
VKNSSKFASWSTCGAATAWRRKLGLAPEQSALAVKLFDYELEPLMRAGAVDYTVMWRQLAEVAALPLDDEDLLAPLSDAFYAAPNTEEKKKWSAFLRKWREAIDGDPAAASARWGCTS